MADRDYDKDQKLREIANLIGDAIVMTVDRPKPGQPTLNEEEKVKIKEQVSEAFSLFMHHREWKEKTDPVILEFKKAYLSKALKGINEKIPHLQRVISEVFPSLDAEFEDHALMNIIAVMTTVGPFRKIKEETLARIIEESMTYIGLAIAYLHWRVETTMPPKGDQH